jgi:hypothetical protein
MPTFQDSLEEIFPHDQVQVIALNKDAPPIPPGPVHWLQNYINFVGNISVYWKADTLTYPMVYDSTHAIFTDYEAGTLENPLPSLFLVDQAGKIRLRSNGASEEGPFVIEFNAVMDSIRGLLDNPPNH